MKQLLIAVSGANGQLGREFQFLANQSPFEFLFLDRSLLDISQPDAISALFEKYSFDVFINAAAYTQVDQAETDYENAYIANAQGPALLAKACADSQTQFIHISTDYVFDGTLESAYPVDYPTNPVNAYGKSKLAGEELAMEANIHSLIIRTSWVYSAFGNNFVKTMLRLGAERETLNVVSDQFGSPTYARDLAAAILELIKHPHSRKGGIYHYCNAGVTNWCEFAKEIMKVAQLDCEVSPIPSTEFPRPAKRPHNSVMDISLISDTFDLKIPYWKDSLKKCLKELIDPNGSVYKFLTVKL